MSDTFCRHGVEAGNYCGKCGREVVSPELAFAERAFREAQSKLIEAEGDKPKVARTSRYMAELRASLKNGLDASNDVDGEIVALEARVAALEAERDNLRAASQKVADAFTAWAEDHNDGTYAYWRDDDLMEACVNLRAALAAATPADQFCGRTDLKQHTWHHWWRLPDGSYGDEGEGGVLVRCPGAPPDVRIPEESAQTHADPLDPHVAAGEKVTHGRHCSCSACAREDWTRITGPCGMHGADCPAVYAPLSGGTGER